MGSAGWLWGHSGVWGDRGEVMGSQWGTVMGSQWGVGHNGVRLWGDIGIWGGCGVSGVVMGLQWDMGSQWGDAYGYGVTLMG